MSPVFACLRCVCRFLNESTNGTDMKADAVRGDGHSPLFVGAQNAHTGSGEAFQYFAVGVAVTIFRAATDNRDRWVNGLKKRQRRRATRPIVKVFTFAEAKLISYQTANYEV